MAVPLERLLGRRTMLLFNFVIIISPISTLDSTLASSVKLATVGMKAGR